MIGFLWSLCLHTIFLWCGEKWTLNNKYPTELIKRRSKVQEKNMSCERALNFDQWKTSSKNYRPMKNNFDQWKTSSKNYRPMRFWFWLTNLSRIIIACDFSPSSFRLKRSILSPLTKTYLNLKTVCHVKLNFSCKLNSQKNWLLTKCLSVAAAWTIFWKYEGLVLSFKSFSI